MLVVVLRGNSRHREVIFNRKKKHLIVIVNMQVTMSRVQVIVLQRRLMAAWSVYREATALCI